MSLVPICLIFLYWLLVLVFRGFLVFGYDVCDGEKMGWGEGEVVSDGICEEIDSI